jgi:hypothetical protein
MSGAIPFVFSLSAARSARSTAPANLLIRMACKGYANHVTGLYTKSNYVGLKELRKNFFALDELLKRLILRAVLHYLCKTPRQSKKV